MYGTKVRQMGGSLRGSLVCEFRKDDRRSKRSDINVVIMRSHCRGCDENDEKRVDFM